jgi:hypothetical protein
MEAVGLASGEERPMRTSASRIRIRPTARILLFTIKPSSLLFSLPVRSGIAKRLASSNVRFAGKPEAILPSAIGSCVVAPWKRGFEQLQLSRRGDTGWLPETRPSRRSAGSLPGCPRLSSQTAGKIPWYWHFCQYLAPCLRNSIADAFKTSSDSRGSFCKWISFWLITGPA